MCNAPFKLATAGTIDLNISKLLPSKLISVAKPLLEIEVNDVNKSFCELLEQKSEILRRQNSSLIIKRPKKLTSIC